MSVAPQYKFAQVAIPGTAPRPFTYAIPETLRTALEPGSLVAGQIRELAKQIASR